MASVVAKMTSVGSKMTSVGAKMVSVGAKIGLCGSGRQNGICALQNGFCARMASVCSKMAQNVCQHGLWGAYPEIGPSGHDTYERPTQLMIQVTKPNRIRDRRDSVCMFSRNLMRKASEIVQKSYTPRTRPHRWNQGTDLQKTG